MSNWGERIGSWLALRTRRARAVSRSAALPQQGELSLSLDEVTVMRNDLSDCDVEIVPAKRAVAATKREALGAGGSVERALDGREMAAPLCGQRSEVGGQKSDGENGERGNGGLVVAWGRATSRLFGAGKT